MARWVGSESGIAVAVVQVGNCSSDTTMSLGTSYAAMQVQVWPLKKKKEKRQIFIRTPPPTSLPTPFPTLLLSKRKLQPEKWP